MPSGFTQILPNRILYYILLLPCLHVNFNSALKLLAQLCYNYSWKSDTIEMNKLGNFHVYLKYYKTKYVILFK